MAWFRRSGGDAPELPQPGQFGPYYMQELINTGGMASIWLATDAQGRTFALRRLHHHLRFHLPSKRRFVRGCEILSKIDNHEYVIGYERHGKIDGDLYLLMEYVEGSNVKLLHARSDSTLEESIGNVLIDMAIALEHVHESGFIHLDFIGRFRLKYPTGINCQGVIIWPDKNHFPFRFDRYGPFR